MSKPTPESKQRALASRDVEDIESLRKTPAFQRYFERRVLGELNRHRDVLLYEKNLTKDQLWEARLKFDAAYDLSIMLLQDEAACRRLIIPSQDEDEK